MLPNEDESIGDHIERDSEAAPLGAHHELEALQIFAPLRNRRMRCRHLSCFRIRFGGNLQRFRSGGRNPYIISSELKDTSSQAAEKTHFRGRGKVGTGFSPVHKPGKIIRPLGPEVRSSFPLYTNHPVFRSLFSRTKTASVTMQLNRPLNACSNYLP